MNFVNFDKLRYDLPVEEVLKLSGIDYKPAGKNFRAKCPFCNTRDSVFINNSGDPKHALWYAHCCSTPGRKVGGDVAGLYAKVKGLSPRDAAAELKAHFSLPADKRPDVRIDKDEVEKLDYLVEDHEACKALGLEPFHCALWQAGYAPKGTMAGYVCIPIFQNGKRLGYIGYKPNEPMKRHKSIPQGALFNVDAVQEKEPIHIATDPLSAILAMENGVPNVISFLGVNDLHSLANLVLLMKEKGINEYLVL